MTMQAPAGGDYLTGGIAIALIVDLFTRAARQHSALEHIDA